MNEWKYEPGEIKDYVGFVYKITEISSGKKYIGIKRFWKTIKLKPLKGKKNKRHKIVESDWRTYNSSNKELAEKIKNNPENYLKEVLYFCKSITDMKGREAQIQLDYYFTGRWNELFNQVINLRVRIRKGE